MARFLELIGDMVRAGLIEVHAFSILTTHFHFLVRSLIGELSEAFRIPQNAYVRSFNRSLKRDGPLVRGRFGSRRIDDSAYWETVVRYIDLNAVEAGMVDIPSDYPHCSARAYSRSSGPDRLTRELVEAVVVEAENTERFVPETYDAWAMNCSPAACRHLVEVAGRQGAPRPEFDDLIRCASLHQQSWMEFKARLADATKLGTVFVSPETVKFLVAVRRQRAPDLRHRPRARRGSLWTALEAGMLRDACGLTFREVGQHMGTPIPTVTPRYAAHRTLAEGDERYRQLVARIVRRALRIDLPPPRRALELPLRVPVLEAIEDSGFSVNSPRESETHAN